MSLEISDLSRRYGAVAALDRVSLRVAAGGFLAVLGPSGCGKTTLLRILAGLETADAGTVRLDGVDFLALDARRREAGLVFQSYALFEHMTVADNIAFGLECRPRGRRPSRRGIAERVEALLALLRIEGLGGRMPGSLSGGQRQRVALARALAPQPRLLLLDEPFGALDTPVRLALREELRRLHGQSGVTTVLVTHDREEALDLAAHAAVMRAGRIEQQGAPPSLEEAPANPFVFAFLGETNRLACRVRQGRIEGLEDAAPQVIGPPPPDGAAMMLFRPAETRLSRSALGPAARVAGIRARGLIVRVDLTAADGAALAVELAASDPVLATLSLGAAVTLHPNRVMLQSPGDL